ncbi:MAG: hypothetical protein N4A76_11605 [Firmicutes bacterium]|nr:hypothetical protein [Bacillota bacterium]
MVKLFWKTSFLVNDAKEKVRSIMNNKGEFGIGSVLSIAAALIVSAFVLIPELKSLAESMMTGMTDWWAGTNGGAGISNKIFPKS